jgi:hypothetical protein
MCLEMAIEVTSREFFGSLYNQAVAYRAAHFFTVICDAGGGTIGVIKELGGGAPVASATEGKLSVSFARSEVSDVSGLDSTKYGRMLLGLIKSRPRMGVNCGGIL